MGANRVWADASGWVMLWIRLGLCWSVDTASVNQLMRIACVQACGYTCIGAVKGPENQAQHEDFSESSRNVYVCRALLCEFTTIEKYQS